MILTSATPTLASQPQTPPMEPPIAFSPLYTTGKELEYIQKAIASGNITGDGHFTKLCQAWLEQQLGAAKVLLTHSCTAALEMSALLADIQPGDEVIMPSYTFVSTANAVVLRGGVPVFVDIRPDTLNLDETKVEAAITSRTKAIAPVHYAGVGCEMDSFLPLVNEHSLMLIEDAAQAFGARYNQKPLGSFGSLSCFSFHATKNIVSGEGGALVINDPALIERAEILWEKGTNRKQYFRGAIDKYTWVDIGSSYLPSDLLAAFLWAQLGSSEAITQHRLSLWQRYHQAFAGLELQGQVIRPQIPANCDHNAHIYYLLVQDVETQARVLEFLKSNGIGATFHYVPLHSAPAGQKYCRVSGDLSVTENLSQRLVRLPLSAAVTPEQADRVISLVLQALDPHF